MILSTASLNIFINFLKATLSTVSIQIYSGSIPDIHLCGWNKVGFIFFII